MSNRQIVNEINGNDSLLVAELIEFSQELGKGSTLTKSDLRYLEDRYRKFSGLAPKLSGETGQLCKSLLNETALKITKVYSAIADDYQKRIINSEEAIGPYAKSPLNDKDRNYLFNAFERLSSFYESDLPEETKKIVYAVSEKVAVIGGII
jgi:hypothetical protein